MTAFTVRYYRTANGRVPLHDWLRLLKDEPTRIRIAKRIERLERGSLGDWKSLGGGVFELRVDLGPGYRIYDGKEAQTLILLLCGGAKLTQLKDIKRAHGYWQDFKARFVP